jgi:hypothetical protein
VRKFRSSGHHLFWPDNLPLSDTFFDVTHASGHRQLTDICLLGLPVKGRGRLAAFDRTIPLEAVAGASRQSPAVISPK